MTTYSVDRFDKYGRRIDFKYATKLCDALRLALRWTGTTDGTYATVRTA